MSDFFDKSPEELLEQEPEKTPQESEKEAYEALLKADIDSILNVKPPEEILTWPKGIKKKWLK